MKLHAHPIAERAISQITSHQLGVSGITYDKSIQISQNNGVTVWPVSAITDVTEAHIKDWIVQKPELIIIGTGKKHLFLSPKLCVQLSNAGIGIECMNTGAAARTYNVLLDEGRHVLGAFILD